MCFNDNDLQRSSDVQIYSHLGPDALGLAALVSAGSVGWSDVALHTLWLCELLNCGFLW